MSEFETAEASVSVTVEPSTSTPLSPRVLPPTVTPNALLAGSDDPSSASSYCSVSFVPFA